MGWRLVHDRRYLLRQLEVEVEVRGEEPVLFVVR